METCRCCGQRLPSIPRTTLWVDDAVMALCNAAFEEAARRGSAEVEVGHLLLRAVRDQAMSAELRKAGIESWRLEVSAERALRSERIGSTPGRPRTSDGLRHLLEETERVAGKRGEQFSSAADLLTALASQSFADADLATMLAGGSRSRERERLSYDYAASSSSQDRADLSAPSGGYRWETREGRDRGAWRDREATSGRVPSAHEPGRVADGGVGRADGQGDGNRSWQPQRHDPADPDTGELTRRLAAQERLLAELLARLPADGRGRNPREQQRRTLPGESGARHQWLRRRARIRHITGLRSLFQATRSSTSHGHGDPLAAGHSVERFMPGMNRPKAPQAKDPLRHAEIDRLDAEVETDDGPETTGERGKRFYLTVDDDIVRAPSIGPKTAARLAACGLFRVGHLLACDPQRISAAVGVQWITPKRIADWQAQARLVCTVPWLRGTHAQLLVGAGFETVTKLREAGASAVCAAVLKFAGTRDGQSILRSGPVPDMERIARWLDHANLAEPGRAGGLAPAEAI